MTLHKEDKTEAGPPCIDMTILQGDQPASGLIRRSFSSSAADNNHHDWTFTVCRNTQVPSVGSFHASPVGSRGTRNEPAFTEHWPPGVKDHSSPSSSLDNETAPSQQSPTPVMGLSIPSPCIEDLPATPGSPSQCVTPTKLLRKGSKAHRRAATIPAVFLAGTTCTDTIEPDSQDHIRSEFGIIVTVRERIDFGSLPDQAGRLSFRAMRDSVRGRMSALIRG